MVNPDFELMELSDELGIEETETSLKLLKSSAVKDSIFKKQILRA